MQEVCKSNSVLNMSKIKSVYNVLLKKIVKKFFFIYKEWKCIASPMMIILINLSVM